MKMSLKRALTPSSSSDEAEERPKKDFFLTLPENSKRQRRARQVFDPSDNNLPRNRIKRARTITGPNTTKQLQQHALQHQSLLRAHQQKTQATSTAATTEKQEKEPEKPQEKTEKIPDSPKPSKIVKQSMMTKAKSPKPPPPRSPSPAPPSVTPSSTSEMSDISSCCIVCKGDISSKAIRTIYCFKCETRVHPGCLKNLNDQTEQPPMNPMFKWRCMQCRTCNICSKGRETKNEWLVACQMCNETYHASCHAPALLRKPASRWSCYRCTVEKAVAVGQNTVTYSDKFISASVPICYTPTVQSNLNGVNKEDIALCNGVEYSEEIANVPEWSVEDVIAYFSSHGFQDEADIFMEQAVDGKSLLLMKRMDVLRGLGLKLGPALKIYSHVARMQLTHFGHVPS